MAGISAACTAIRVPEARLSLSSLGTTSSFATRPFPSPAGLRVLRGTATHHHRLSRTSFPSSLGATNVPSQRHQRQLSARAEGERKPWDFFRFVQTLLFFNKPPSLQEAVSSMFAAPAAKPEVCKSPPGLVLVVGATGGVGKRVVDELRSQGIPVRAMVRNLEKARKLLGPDVDCVAADIAQKATLLPEYFEGVTRVINCASCIVGPKEGDTASREKYYQGIKFYDPEIKEDTPERVEFGGMKNLVEMLARRVGTKEGVSFLSVTGSGLPAGPSWGALDDVVMGGVSQSSLQIDSSGGESGGPVAIFTGIASTDNSGGFASIRTKNSDPPADLSAYEGIQLRVKGDGNRYKLIIRTEAGWDTVGYTASFDTEKGVWQDVRVPFTRLVPVFRAKTKKDAAPFNPASVTSLQLMYSKFEYDGQLNPTFQPGRFALPIATIKSYLAEPLTARFVHVGSAGATRPKRPGLDLSKQPPAVQMNDMLGGILTYKLKGEDVLRESGIPYAIVRPCALTEEPAGAELLFEQGDNIMGKIGREEVAKICVSALKEPAACDKTFEVKSTVPFSQPFTIDPNSPPPRRDYRPFFESLKEGVTGKEALESVPVA